MCFGGREKDDSGAARSRELDRIIRQDEKRMSRQVKLLLLGAGESGKSTILKQMKLIYSQGFSKNEKLEWKPVIFGNIVQSFQTIYDAMNELNIAFANPENEKNMAQILVEREIGPNDRLPQEFLAPIKSLWQDDGVKAAIAKGNEYALHDNLEYFVDDIDRLWADEYVPNDQDLLRSRLRTTGITETVFDLGQLTYRMFDVGGQRSERKKWIHCFENVNCLLFLVAISGYDQCLVEDKDGNQMNEALMLWESIANSHWFTKSALILFLNKMDLFKEKLPRSPITEHGFTDYHGPKDDYKAASKYFLDKFRALNRNPEKEIYGHLTNATDTNLLKITMTSVQDMIIQRNLKQLIFCKVDLCRAARRGVSADPWGWGLSLDQGLHAHAFLITLDTITNTAKITADSTKPRGAYSTFTQRYPFFKTKRGIALLIAVPLILLGGLAGLAALPGKSSGSGNNGQSSGAQDAIRDDSHFYGQSPPVYPAPEVSGSDNWSVAYDKARELVSNMTLEEKVSITSGVPSKNGCVGSIGAVKSVKFPGLCLGDAGQGLRGTDFVSSFPSGIHVGASWNKNLTHARAAAMGAEFKIKGVNVLLGPVVGPALRVVRGGRNWEGFSADPYLAGVLAAETVLGVQHEGVITSTKHFIANEQEHRRNPHDGVAAVSSNIDDKTMHELYLWPFQDTVKAGTGNIMCSYQRINNSYGCANSKTMNGLLKTELGFQGFVVSDWFAQHAGVATALSGMDMTMPTGDEFWGEKLVEAVKNGSVPEARLTDMATRILTPWYQMKQDSDFPKPGIGMPTKVTDPHDIVDARNPRARDTLFEGAVEGHVLVKNTKNTLPLRSPKMLSVFGYSAKSPDQYAPAGDDMTSYAWTFGAESSDPREVQAGFGGVPDANYSTIAEKGTIIHGGGSGATTPALFLSPFEALKLQAYKNGTAVFHDFVSAQPVADPASDACLVFGNAWASEGYDRPALRDDYTDGMIKRVADQCNKTIVILHNAGARLVDQFVEHPNVTAVIFAHLPGQDSGNALVSLLYGDSNFSGKLPYTLAKNESDYGHMLGPDTANGRFENFPQSNFTEGIYVDYRHFDREDIEPRYEFGFGLSYTTFEMSRLKIDVVSNADTSEWPTGEVVSGGQKDLWDHVAIITADIRNTGRSDGAEVAQLYVGIPSGPAKQLRGFEKPFVRVNETTNVSFNLTRRDLSVWDVAAQKWRLQGGKYKIYVGNSSRQLPLTGELTLGPSRNGTANAL
ncbi:putative beta-glucosidase M [Paramyrothecium foliicola]|nr:putative beta-glucosidase M [Paramyrothecium foliicola]